jgi:hypothetical protein
MRFIRENIRKNDSQNVEKKIIESLIWIIESIRTKSDEIST